MADKEDDDMDVLHDLMSGRSGRYLLSSKVRRVLVPYLVETLGFQSLEDVESLGAKGFEQGRRFLSGRRAEGDPGGRG